jgi:TATA-box binding protein (TBP) (component of TFIID and TFIIIB)
MGQPEQYIIKFDTNSSMLIFKSGKFRIMGDGDPIMALINVVSITSQFSNIIPEIELQTRTGVYGYNCQINLYLLAQLTDSLLDLENFPAVQMTKFKPVHVNIFSSGCVVMCGLKDIDNGNFIKSYLDSIIVPCIIET